MPNDHDQKDFLSLRPTPDYVPRAERMQGDDGGKVLRLRPRMNKNTASGGRLPVSDQWQSLVCFQAQRIPIRQKTFIMQPQQLRCDDGFRTVVDGRRNVFLTGSGGGCDEMLSILLLHALAENGSVLLLTGDRGETGGSGAVARRICDHYEIPMRNVGESGSGCFLPFANWTQQQMYGYFSQKVAGEYMGHDAAPDTDMLGCVVDLLELMEADRSFAESVADPRFSYQMALEHCEQADMSEAARSKLYDHMINHTETLMKAQGILREFIMAFGVEDWACGAEAYSIFSPGVNRVIIDAQNAVIRGSLPWFLLQMVGYINSLAGSHQKITVLVDRLTPDALQGVMSLLRNSDIRTIMVAGSVMELGDQAVSASILSRSDQVFIFRQQDKNAAEFWAALSGDRKVLLRNYSMGRSTSSQMWQFATRGRSKGNGYTEAFRPKIHAGEFAAMSDNKAYLYMSGDMSAEVFHPFILK